jgi:hypothetical protein
LTKEKACRLSEAIGVCADYSASTRVIHQPFGRAAPCDHLAMTDHWLSLTHALTQTMRNHAPGWTDRTASDPSLTLLDLIAYLAENLPFHATSSDELSSAAARAILALETVAYQRHGTPAQVVPGAHATERWSGTTRPHYFAGQVLGADDFRVEQSYHRDRHRRHLQTLHGSGVVRGLDVSVSPDGAHVTVTPGVAIDASGREIVVDESAVVTPPNPASPVWLVLDYIERAVDPVPTLNDGPQARRIEEGCRIILTTAPSDGGITLARLLRDAHVWRIDETFAPARVR